MSSYAPVQSAKYCLQCNGIMDSRTVSCPHCGAVQTDAGMPGVSEKRLFPAVILCGLFGWCGAHRFYLGRRTSGIVQLITIGGLGIWMMIDMVLLVTGSFTDGDGNRVTKWT